jgi:AraC-like DNA-binding protein
MSVIRGTALRGFPDLVTELGGDPDVLLSRAGIDRTDVGRFDAFFTYVALIHAVESAAAATRTPDFGRRLGARQGIEILGPVGVAARTTGTVADGLAIFEQYLAAYSPAIAVVIENNSATAFVEFNLLLEHPPAHPQSLELSLAVMLRVFRFLFGAGYAPTVVHIPHAPLTDPADYVRYFSCTARFRERRAGFTFPAEDLNRPLARDELAHQVVREYLDTVVGRRGIGMATSIRELIRQLLPTGAATVPVIADQFRLHPKALRRRLVAEGTNFNAVVDDVRRELAERYLRNTDMTLSHLARELGYSEQSVLSRSCQRWFGAGPAQLRETWGSDH